MPIPSKFAELRSGGVLATCLVAVACTTSGALSAAPDTEPERIYDVVYSASIRAGDALADAGIATGRNARYLREISFRFDADRYSGFQADGELDVSDGEVTWNPPRSGGVLHYRVRIPHRRTGDSFDALVEDDWAIFRGGDLFPPARTRVVRGARSRSTLVFDLPAGWSALTPYLSGDGDLEFQVENPARNFDRPTGWMLVGDIGVRRGRIAGRRVAIGAPAGQGLRRMDIMAFLNWTLPGVITVFPAMDDRLVIVGAGDPMWRGGLSGPGSMFVHADRPLISENGTSTFLHELVHVAMGAAGSSHDDWLVEGLAEYYSIKVLRTSGTLAPRRSQLTLESLAEWGAPVDDLFVRRSEGPVTARATTLLASLDRFLTDASHGRRSLDTVVGQIVADGGTFDYRSLCVAAQRVARGPVPVLEPANVPGAPDVAECRGD